jgi:hypothetical protein
VHAPASRAQEIAARLAASGFEPRVLRQGDYIRVEAGVPDAVSATRWSALLAALDRADCFGLDGDAEGRTAWAAISRNPRSGTTAQGHGHPATGS